MANKTVLAFALIIISVFGFQFAQAQQQIEINLENAPKGYFTLSLLQGAERISVDSAKTINGKLVLKGRYDSGLYALIKNGKGFSFIVNENKIRLQADWNAGAGSLKVLESEENRWWTEYLMRRNITYGKLNVIQPVTMAYDRDSEFYRQATKEFYTVQGGLRTFVSKIPRQTLASLFARADLRPRLAHNMSFSEQRLSMKKNWFANVDWTDSRLLNSDILTNKINDFMSICAGRGASRPEVERGMKEGVDILLSATQANPQIHEYALSLLVKKLETYGIRNPAYSHKLRHPYRNLRTRGPRAGNNGQTQKIRRLKGWKKSFAHQRFRFAGQ
ncbi:hypothetical protein FUAX_49930 (plasmid) [Fulvitalea axinellae]|uniref:DUF4369 domain-containing protein n=1 Tax=Fulvitalea axinellae TaxID=1182444 RepID=A0AAU9CKI2_9BACT|nr:hypothetical protein FUAX_49930 [Fulvitalea axinellae]